MMMMTWKERREALEARGITSPDLLEVARRATAPERVAARHAEVLALLEGEETGIHFPAGAAGAAAGLVAALDCLGAAGPLGAGGPGGCSARVPPLGAIPRHQAQCGGAWDGAVRAHAWDAIVGWIDSEHGGVWLSPSPGDERAGVWLSPPAGIDPEWWAPLVPWLSALAHRVVLEAECPDRAPRWPEDGEISVEISGEVANFLAELASLESARRTICESRELAGALLASPPPTRAQIDGVVENVRRAWWDLGTLPWNLTVRASLAECETAIAWAEARARAGNSCTARAAAGVAWRAWDDSEGEGEDEKKRAALYGVYFDLIREVEMSEDAERPGRRRRR